ncbi:MAG: hypothetical protein IJA10_12300 [Lachnospiraceae bacterium]|nr:hypothetical protein [Lachnospiraceae bacterium]
MVSIVTVVILLLGSIPAMSSKAATSKNQESTRGIRAGSSWYVKNIIDTDISKSFVYRKEKREIYLDGTKMMTCPEMQFETVSELLFGSGKGRIYYFKIWDENGTLMKDYIPVKDKEGIVCMYEVKKAMKAERTD